MAQTFPLLEALLSCGIAYRQIASDSYASVADMEAGKATLRVTIAGEDLVWYVSYEHLFCILRSLHIALEDGWQTIARFPER
jgi:hypothetical protein